MRGRTLWLAGCGAGLAGAAAAQEGDRGQGGQIPPPKPDWKLQFEPSVSFGAAGGKVMLPGSPVGVPSTKIEDLNLDGPRAAPEGELILTSEPWGFMLRGYRLETGDHDQVAAAPGQVGPVVFSAGDVLRSSLRLTEVEAVVLRKIELPDSINGSSGKAFAARLDVLGGLRMYDVGFDVAGPGGGTSANGFFGHPLVGAKLTMDITDQFTIDAQVDLGLMATGSDSMSYGYDIVAGFMWHPTQTFGVQIGYRDLAFLLRKGPEGDRFEFTGAVQGLYAGAVLRF